MGGKTRTWTMDGEEEGENEEHKNMKVINTNMIMRRKTINTSIKTMNRKPNVTINMKMKTYMIKRKIITHLFKKMPETS